MYQSIVVVIDIEKDNTSLLNKAIKIAKNNDTSLTIIYVAQMIIIDNSGYEFSSDIITPGDNQETINKLEAIKQDIINKGVACQYELVCGVNIANTILDDVYNKYHYDLLICGSNNRSEISEFFLGSVSAKLADKCCSDIYIVK